MKFSIEIPLAICSEDSLSRLMRMNGKEPRKKEDSSHVVPSIIVMEKEVETALKSMIIVFLTELNLSMLFTLQNYYILKVITFGGGWLVNRRLLIDDEILKSVCACWKKKRV